MFSFVDSNRPSYRLSSSIGGVCGEIHRTTQPITTHQRGKTRPKRPGIGEARANFSHNWTEVLSFAATRVRALTQSLIPELERCVEEVQVAWFVMENVRDAPLPAVRGYQVHAQLLNNRWFGGVQNRVRRISFGTRDGCRLNLPGEVLEPAEWAPAVYASGDVKPGADLRRSPRANELGYKTRAAFEEIRRLQGLPDGFELPNFTVAGAIEAVGNGVPLPLGRAIAKAVWSAMSEVGEDVS